MWYESAVHIFVISTVSKTLIPRTFDTCELAHLASKKRACPVSTAEMVGVQALFVLTTARRRRLDAWNLIWTSSSA